jgi:Uma2 family endonuclease
VQLGWLIDPLRRTVTIHGQGTEPLVRANPSKVAGQGPVEGFTLDLTEIW